MYLQILEHENQNWKATLCSVFPESKVNFPNVWPSNDLDLLIQLLFITSHKKNDRFFIDLSVVFRPNREFFTHTETSPLPVKGLQILTYAEHSWPLSCEGSLACHTFCDTGHLFIMVIFEDLWHSHLFGSGAITTCL